MTSGYKTWKKMECGLDILEWGLDLGSYSNFVMCPIITYMKELIFSSIKHPLANVQISTAVYH